MNKSRTFNQGALLDAGSKKLLISLPSSMVELLDEAAAVFGMCRSDVIRRSLTRDLEFVKGYEIPDAAKQAEKGRIAHMRWFLMPARRDFHP